MEPRACRHFEGQVEARVSGFDRLRRESCIIGRVVNGRYPGIGGKPQSISLGKPGRALPFAPRETLEVSVSTAARVEGRARALAAHSKVTAESILALGLLRGLAALEREAGLSGPGARHGADDPVSSTLGPGAGLDLEGIA